MKKKSLADFKRVKDSGGKIIERTVNESKKTISNGYLSFLCADSTFARLTIALFP